jgi:hypothetical protein
MHNKLVNDLYEENLNQVTYGIYKFENGKITYCLKGNIPQAGKLLGFIGGNTEIKYTKKYINDELLKIIDYIAI